MGFPMKFPMVSGSRHGGELWGAAITGARGAVMNVLEDVLRR